MTDKDRKKFQDELRGLLLASYHHAQLRLGVGKMESHAYAGLGLDVLEIMERGRDFLDRFQAAAEGPIKKDNGK